VPRRLGRSRLDAQTDSVVIGRCMRRTSNFAALRARSPIWRQHQSFFYLITLLEKQQYVGIHVTITETDFHTSRFTAAVSFYLKFTAWTKRIFSHYSE